MKRSRKRATGGAAEPEIDPRTEQVLRQALERSDPASRPDLSTEPVPAISPESAIAVDDSISGGSGTRAARPKIGSLAPVSVADPHFHQDPHATQQREPEEDAEGDSVADSYDRLRGLMADLPIKAGTGKVKKNLEAVALATLSYYRYALAEPAGGSFPLGVTTGARSSVEDDIAILAGYLDLEKRFDRVDESLDSRQVAKQLMAALASRALAGTEARAAADRSFVHRKIRECLPEPAGAAAGPAAGSGPDRRTEGERLTGGESRRAEGSEAAGRTEPDAGEAEGAESGARRRTGPEDGGATGTEGPESGARRRTGPEDGGATGTEETAPAAPMGGDPPAPAADGSTRSARLVYRRRGFARRRGD